MANHRVSDPRFPAPFSYHGSQTETDDDTIARHRNRALNLVPLKTASSIVIPTMVTEGSTFFNKVEEKLSSFFRGFTVTPGGGSWTDPMGNTIDEHVFVISASSDKSSTEVRYFLTEIANLILDETEEQAVFFSVAGTGFLLNKQENENATT